MSFITLLLLGIFSFDGVCVTSSTDTALFFVPENKP